jgi:dTDP-4-amino-4,6-dideoxygalactose transaminase
MARLAIKGAKPIRQSPLPNYQVMGEDEAKAAYDVVKGGILSDFLGSWGPEFFGGEQVQELEKEWAQHFKVKHAVSVNSNTSGLITALGAIGIGPGDEVIVSPYSMSISAAAPLFWGALPVFADIDPDYFCLNVDDIERKITKRTKAILAVDIFGQVFDHQRLRELARPRRIAVVEDCAQAPGAKAGDLFSGSLGDIGIFSLNYHKHIHTGEGGVIVTNDEDLATRCRLIRNHAEAVVDEMGYQGNPANLVGMNLRMTEVEAAIGRVQLRKLDSLVDRRIQNVERIEKGIDGIPFLTMPAVRKNSKHVYYAHVLKFDSVKAGASREQFVKAVNAELVPDGVNASRNSMLGCGYVKPLYLQSLYQRRIGIGAAHFPFENPMYDTKPSYDRGLCPVTERMHFQEVIVSDLIHPGLERHDCQDIIDAFSKVSESMDELR